MGFDLVDMKSFEDPIVGYVKKFLVEGESLILSDSVGITSDDSVRGTGGRLALTSRRLFLYGSRSLLSINILSLSRQ